MTMEDRISLSISTITCLRIIFLLSGFLNTCRRKMQYFPIELKILAVIFSIVLFLTGNFSPYPEITPHLEEF